MTYSVFGGYGFIGSEICKDPNYVPMPRYTLAAETNQIVYLISTIHNYHPVDGDFHKDIQTNLSHLMSVFEANKRKFGSDFEITYVSTWFVYGKVEPPAVEDMCCNPRGFYSATKLCAENLIATACETFGMRYKIVRLSNVLGIGDNKLSTRKNALQHMIKTLCEGGTVNLYEGDTYRDFIHVSDAAAGIRAVAERGKMGEIYNVGSGVCHRVADLIWLVSRSASGHVNTIPVPQFHKTVQVDSMWLNVEKIERDTGWRATRNVYDIIEELVDKYEQGPDSREG